MSITKALSFGLLALATVTGAELAAHHSSAVYDMQRTIKVTGKVTNVRWINPHAYFFVDVKGKDGTVASWQFFLDAPNHLVREGWPHTTLKPGDVVTIEAAPSRGSKHKGFAWSATFPNGRKVLNVYENVPVREIK